MKTKLTVSTDGINEEVFNDVECFGDKSDSDIVKYAKSAVTSIAEIMLELRIKVPQKPLSLVLEHYGNYCRIEWQDGIERLRADISTQKEDHLIDDIILLLREAKNHIVYKHQSHYNILKNIVLEHCQMDDPSVL